MYELSLNLPTETANAPVNKKNGFPYDSPSSAQMLDELRTDNGETSDDALSVLGFDNKKSGQAGGYQPIFSNGETLSEQVNGVRTTDGNNLVDEYLRNLKDLMRRNEPTLTDEINNLETTEANNLVEEYDKGLKGIKASMYDVKKPTLVRFWANWCGYSTQSKPAWDEFEKSSSIPGLQIVDLDVGNDPIKQNLAKKINVTGFPTILLFKDGKIYNCKERSVDGIQLFCNEHMRK
jgi:thioredoxin 1